VSVHRPTRLNVFAWCLRQCHLLSFGLAISLFPGLSHAADGWVALPQPGLAVRAMGDEPQALALAQQARVLAVALKDIKGLAWLNPDTGAELGRVALGRLPVAIALNATGDMAYLLLEGSAQIHVLSLRSKAIVNTWAAGDEPAALALSANGDELVVADRALKRLVAFNPSTGALVRTLHMDKVPSQLAFGQPAGGSARLLVAAQGGLLLTLDAATWHEISRVTVGDDIRALGMWDGGGMALAVGKRQDALNVINPATGAVTNRIPLDGDPERLATDGAGHRAYVTTRDDLSVNRIDMHSGALQGRYAIPDRAGGLVFDPQSRVLLLSQPRSERLLRLDPEQASLVYALTLKRRLRDLTVNNTTHELVAIADQGEELTRLNLLTRQGHSVKLPGSPRLIGVDPVLNRAVISIAHRKHELVFVDLAAATPTLYPERLDVQGDVQALAVDPVRKRTVMVGDGRRVSVADNDSRTFLGTVAGTESYEDVAIHAGTGKAYLLTRTGALQQFDPATLTIEKTWPLHLDGQHLAVDAVRNLVLISSRRGSKVHRFDLGTQVISNAFDFAQHPGQIALHPDHALAVILSRESSKVGTLDLAAHTANAAFATIAKPHRVAVSTRFNQAFVLTAEKDEVEIVQLLHPVPAITTLNPAQVSAGGPALTLTVDGSKFVDGSLVLANDTLLTTRWINGQTLEATVPASMMAAATTLRITVKTNGPGGGVSNSVNLVVAAASPVLSGFSPAQLYANGQPQTLTLIGQNFKNGDIVQVGAQALTPASITPTQITVQIPGALLGQAGALPITVKNAQGAPSATLSLPVAAVSMGPVITGISPTKGPVGTQVTITGSNFATNASGNQVTFAGDVNNAATRVAAPIVSASTTQLVVAVPQNAVTGNINLATPSGNAIGPVFMAQQAIDVSFTASPVNTTVYQGANTNISLVLNNTGTKDYTGLMQLKVTGLPAGITATLSSQFLSKGQNGSVLLTASSSAAITTSPVAITVTATDTAGLGITRTATFRISVAASAGISGIKGRFVTPEGAGIGSVRVAYQDGNGNLVSQVQSDSAGAFTLTDLPAGSVTLRMDATPAHPLYPIWPYTMNNPGNGLVSLPDWVINPPPADDKFVTINNATQDQAVTDERYPGLAITLPAGVSIIGWDGVQKTRLAVERITPDKLPVSTPPFPMKEAYQLYFGTPMGGIPSAPIPITLPNVAEAEPGEKRDIWFFDGSPMGGTGEWKIAGQGVVSADGKTVTTLPGQGITRFCGVCGLFSLSCPPTPKPPPCNNCPKGPTGGNPVDLLTGQEAPKSIGLSLAGVNSVNVNMSYNPVDAFDGKAGTFASFGLGWTLNYDIVLVQNGTQARVFMPGGRLVDFNNAGNNTYKVINDPGFDGAEISASNASADLWQIRHRDGRIWKFAPYPGIDGWIRGGPPLFVTEMIDAQGNATFITRQTNGRINAVGSNSRNIKLTYGANGFVSGIIDTANRSMAFTYNAKNRIETVTDADSKITKYTYVGDNEITSDAVCGAQATMGERIKTITYPGKPNPTENFYGVAKRVLRQIASDGRETQFSYKLTGACVTHISKPGVQCADATCPTEDNWANHQAGWRVHGGQVFATTLTNPDGTTNTWRYAADNTPVEHIDAMGQKTLYKYDSFKRKIEEKDALGRVTKYQYDEKGNKSLIIDPLQRVTRMTYDSKWNAVTSTTRYNDSTPFGQANPQTRTIQYDAATGVLKTATSPLNSATHYSYTAQGLMAKITAPGGSTTQLTYTPEGDVQKVIDALGRDTQFGYDAAGRSTVLTDAKGYSTQTQYNGVDQPTQVTDALGGQTKFTFDASQRLASVTNPLNNVIQSNTYDDGDRLKTQANALNQIASNVYDNAGRLVKTTDPAGHVSTYSYDSAGRLVTITLPEGSHNLNYDLIGRVTRVSDAGSSLEYDYDGADRVIRHTQKAGTRTTTVDYVYDALDRLIRRMIASVDAYGASLAADTTEYQYDNGNRITQIVYKGNGSKNDVTGYTWDADNRLTQKTLSNGIKVGYQYDLANQLKQIEYTGTGSTVIDRIQYTYDANGQIIQRDSLNALGKDETPYTAIYNAANRLTQITLNPGTANQASYSLMYDASGNLIQKQNINVPADTTAYQWDSRNRLTQVNAPGIIASFQYDSMGRRIAKTVNGQTTTYLYDGQQAIGEIQPTSNVVNSHEVRINLTGVNLDEAIARYTQTQSGNTITAQQSSSYLNDILGSVIAQVKADQTVEARYAYSPYGEVGSQGNDNQNAMQYTARENDSTGLYFYRARYYDPVLKRFISSDPIGLGGGLNTYAYVDGNPISYVDLDGQMAGTAAGALAGGMVAGPPGAVVGAIVGTVVQALAATAVVVTVASIPGDTSPKQAAYGPRPVYTPAQEAQLDAEHKAYKNLCTPPPGLDPCELAKWEKNNLQGCIDARQNWDNKWWPGRHAVEIQNTINRLAKAAGKIAKYCPCP
jgi:RHS repeat-associated protein